jgi:hypothetical protein
MKHILLPVLVFLVFTSFKPSGSGTAHLRCKSESGKTIFNADIHDITGVLDNAVFEIEKQKLAFTPEDNVYAIFDPLNRVFTIYLSGKTNDEFPNSRFVQFWAIPGTFKTLMLKSGGQKYVFEAYIEATEPRKGKLLRTPPIKLSCTLEYEI